MAYNNVVYNLFVLVTLMLLREFDNKLWHYSVVESVCLFVCLFVCLLDCFHVVCLFVCFLFVLSSPQSNDVKVSSMCSCHLHCHVICFRATVHKIANLKEQEEHITTCTTQIKQNMKMYMHAWHKLFLCCRKCFLTYFCLTL